MPAPAYIAYAVGVLGSLIFFDYVVKNTNTKANRQQAVDLIKDNINITGFATLRDWVTLDGFIEGKQYTEPPNLPTTYSIGEGAGKTVLGESQTISDWLRSLTASGLLSVVNKAINHSPRGDTIQDRQMVLGWLNLVQSQVNNFEELYRILNQIGWVTKNPQIPADVDVPIYIRFGTAPNQVVKYDYRDFLLKAKTVDILGLVDELVYPKDKDLEARELVYLSVVEGADVVPNPIEGFKEFGTMLNFGGFIASPQTRKLPDKIPATFTLGGSTYTQAELTNILQTATAESISKVVSLALLSYDPTLQPRINALATLAQTMNNYENTTGFAEGVQLVDLYGWLKASGFTSSKRVYKPVDTSKFAGVIYSFGWFAPPDINEFLKTATASQVSEVAQLGSKTGIAYEKYLAVKTGMNQNIENAMFGVVQGGVADEFTEQWGYIYQVGALTSPAQILKPDILNNKLGTHIVGGKPVNELFPQPLQTVGFRVPFDSNEPVSKIPNYIFSGLPSTDLLLAKIWIGNDPSDPPMGVLVKNDIAGRPNPFFNQFILTTALAEAKAGKEVLLPDKV